MLLGTSTDSAWANPGKWAVCRCGRKDDCSTLYPRDVLHGTSVTDTLEMLVELATVIFLSI